MVKKFTALRKTLNRVAGKISQKFSRRKASSPSQNKPDKKVLMFGWELPPFNSGGLGVACYELASSITLQNTAVTFVLPKKQEISVPFMKVTFPDGGEDNEEELMSIKQVDTLISPYATTSSYKTSLAKGQGKKRLFNWKKYRPDLIGEVHRYGDAAVKIAKKEKFDVIHAHDWLSYPAGVRAKEVSKKPLVAHVHALEYDRCHLTGVNPDICAIEKEGLEKADKVIAISHYVKNRVMSFYNIPESKIEVVHNGITIGKQAKRKTTLKKLKSNGQKMVLFVGRITYQKGVDYLIAAAAKAIKLNPKIFFMIAGSGDMQNQIVNQAAELGISDKVFFPGFLRSTQLDDIYKAADLFVMPSVSEPFGLVALEAMVNRVPIIISRQSGVAEVVEHALKVNFWDVDDLANKIVVALNNKSLRKTLSVYGYDNASRCSWDLAAEKCINIYNNLAVT